MAKDPRFVPRNIDTERKETPVQGNQILNNTITKEHIQNGAITTEKFNSNAAPTVNTIYTNNWFRSNGNTGWYNETYGGGIWMTDTTWIRTYGSKNFYSDKEIRGNILRSESYIAYGSGNAWSLISSQVTPGIGSINKYAKAFSAGASNIYPAIVGFRVNRGWTSFYFKITITTYYYLGSNKVTVMYFYQNDTNPWLISFIIPYSLSGGNAGFGLSPVSSQVGAVDVGYSDFLMSFSPLNAYTSAFVEIEIGNLSVVSSYSGDSKNQMILY